MGFRAKGWGLGFRAQDSVWVVIFKELKGGPRLVGVEPRDSKTPKLKEYTLNHIRDPIII